MPRNVSLIFETVSSCLNKLKSKSCMSECLMDSNDLLLIKVTLSDLSCLISKCKNDLLILPII